MVQGYLHFEFLICLLGVENPDDQILRLICNFVVGGVEVVGKQVLSVLLVENLNGKKAVVFHLRR